MNKDFPCVCSHSKEKHNPYMFKQRQYSPESYLQTACYYVTNGGDILCGYCEYKQDNLRYLEMKAYEENI